MKHPSRNQAGPHRPVPPCPPIDPNLVYPWRKLRDWGWGARSAAAMQRAGLRVLRYSKWKFIRGADLIDFLEGNGSGEQGGSGNV